MNENPFLVLDIEPTEDIEAIKAAFRRRSKLLHPDANPDDPEAARKFIELKSAYKKLGDVSYRVEAFRRFRRVGARPSSPVSDVFSSFFKTLDEHPSRPLAKRGADTRRKLTIPLESAFRGGVFLLSGASRACGVCDGLGKLGSSTKGKCPDCEGRGLVMRASGARRLSFPCRTCEGSGVGGSKVCVACDGVGQIKSGDVSVEISAGVRDGTVIPVRGSGAPGMNGGGSGDLFVTVEVEPHPIFSRVGDDLTVEARIPVWDAALGSRISVRDIEGDSHEFDIYPGMNLTKNFYVKGRGMPKSGGTRGDMVVHVAVLVPPATGEMAALYLRMREIATR